MASLISDIFCASRQPPQFHPIPHSRLRREHEKLLKQKAKAAEQATKMALPKPVGSVPEPEYLKPGFLATPPPNLGMAQALAKAQAMAQQAKPPPTPAMLQAMQGCQIDLYHR